MNIQNKSCTLPNSKQKKIIDFLSKIQAFKKMHRLTLLTLGEEQ